MFKTELNQLASALAVLFWTFIVYKMEPENQPVLGCGVTWKQDARRWLTFQGLRLNSWQRVRLGADDWC